jgi:hypothetical protein
MHVKRRIRSTFCRQNVKQIRRLTSCLKSNDDQSYSSLRLWGASFERCIICVVLSGASFEWCARLAVLASWILQNISEEGEEAFDFCPEGTVEH